MLPRQAARFCPVPAKAVPRLSATSTPSSLSRRCCTPRAASTISLRHSHHTPQRRLFSCKAVLRAEIGSKDNTTPKSQPGARLEGSDPSNPVPNQSPVDSESANEELRGPKDAEQNEPSDPLPDLRYGIPSDFKPDALRSQDERDSKDPESSEPSTSDEQSKQRNYKSSDFETSTDRRRARLANYMYLALAGGSIVGAVILARPFGDDESPEGLEPRSLDGWAPSDIWTRIKARSWGTVGQFAEPIARRDLLPPRLVGPQKDEQGQIVGDGDPAHVLVLSLDDLLVHTSWTREHGFRFAKRPGFDAFVQYLMPFYELVLYTSSPDYTAEQIMVKLDPYRLFGPKMLFRSFTRFDSGDYVKDLSYLGRPLDKIIAIDTDPGHLKVQPENAIILPKWKGDPKDTHAGDLVALLPLLLYAARSGSDVRKVLGSFETSSSPDGSNSSVIQEFAKREASLRQKARIDPKARAAVQELDQQRAMAKEFYDHLTNHIKTNGAAELKAMSEQDAEMMEKATRETKETYLSYIPGYTYFASPKTPKESASK